MKNHSTPKTSKAVLDFCKSNNITVDQFYGKEKINGDLYLSSVTSLIKGFNPTVGGDLYLSSVTSLIEGFNPTVGGSLYLRSVTSLIKGFNPTVGGYLDLRSVTSLIEGFNPTVGGYLDLSSVTSLIKGFNPTVGGSLYLSSVTSLIEGFNPTVGGSLDLRSVTSLIEGFNPTVGGDLDLSGLTYSERNKVKVKEINRDSYLFSWENGKYIKADGIFTEVISKKGNVYKVKKLNSTKEFYLVTDGNGKFSHGDTVKEAKEDLLFKISNRRKEDYKDLTLKSVLKFEDAVVCYRVITGACSFGTKDFINNKLGKPKKEYKVSEIIKVTEGQYGNESFKKFFKK